MAATTVENLEFHIKKSGMTGEGAKIFKEWADALNELKKAGKGSKDPIPESLVNSISELAGAMKAINGEAISKMRQLAAALKTFDGMKGVKLNAQFASTMADIAAAADLVTDDHIQKLNRFGDAIKNLGGAKNIGDKLADQLLDVAAAADLISDATITRIHRLTLALSRLKGIDLKGLGSIMSEQRRTQEAERKRQSGQTEQKQQEGSGSTQPVRQQTQWTFSLKKNVDMIVGTWLGKLNPAIKLTLSILRAVGSLLGKILKLAWNIAKAVVKWAFKTAINALKKVWELTQKVAKGIANLSVNFGKSLVGNVERIAKGLGTAAKNLGKFAWKNSVVSRMTESIGKLRKVLSSFTRVAFYRIVRSAIKYITESFKEGAERAYFYAKEYGKATKYIAESLDKLSSKEFQMQNQLGAAWSTLLATIQPVLIQLINMVTRAAEVLTQFFAILSGKTTYLKAKDYTHDWADETEKGAKAAKEWKNQLMDFDTLNRLNDTTDNSSDKQEKYKDYENMFEEAPIASWLNELKNMSFPDIGGKIAEWLNGLLKKIDDWFISSRPKWKKYAENLADLLNGFIDKFDWELLGKTVGDGLNAIFDAINTFLKNVRWYDLGRGVGRAIKSLFDTVEWDLIGETFANKWNALMHFIEGVVTTPGIWKSIGRSIGQFVKAWIDNIDILSLANSVVHIINGVSTMIGAFLDQNPFQNLAPKLNDAIFLVITAVRWDELGTNIGRLFQTCLNTLFDIVSNFPFAQLGHNIAIFLDNMGSQIDFSQLGHLLMSIGLGLWKTLYGAVQYLEATGGIANMAKRLSDFIVGALTELAEWLESLDPRVIANALKQFFGNIDYQGIKDAFVRVVKAAWYLAVGLKDEIFDEQTKTAISNKINNFFATTDWEKIGNTIKDRLSKAWTWVTARFNEIWPEEDRERFWQNFNTILKSLLTMAIQKIDVKGLWKTFKEEMKKQLEDAATVSVGGFDFNLIEGFKRVAGYTIPDCFKQPIRVARATLGLLGNKENSEMAVIGKETAEGYELGLNKAFTDKVWNTVDALFFGVPGLVKRILGIQSPSTVFDEIGQYTIAGFLQGLVTKFKEINTFFTNMVTSFSTVGSNLVTALQSGFSSMWGSFTSAVSSLVTTLVNGISQTVQNGFSGLGTAIGSAVNTASGKLQELAGKARTSINTVLENSKTSLNGIVSSIQNAVNNIISQANAILSKIRGRSYATGGFPEDGVFFANHNELVGQFSNGKTAVANNEQIVSGIKQGVYQAVTQAMGGASSGNGEKNQPINIYIGDELVYSGYAAWNRRQQVITGGRA